MRRLRDKDVFWTYFAIAITVITILAFLWGEILGAFLWSLLIAALLQPLMGFMHAKLSLPRTFSATILVVGFLGIVALLIGRIIPMINQSLTTLAQDFPRYGLIFHGLLQKGIEHIPSAYQGILQEQLTNLQASLGDHLSTIASYAVKFMGEFFLKAARVINLISMIVLAPLLIFYFLKDWPLMQKSFESWIPQRGRGAYKQLKKEVLDTLLNYFKGQMSACALLGLYYGLGLSIFVDLPYAWTLGITAGFMAFIPYAGFLTALLTALGVAFASQPLGPGLYDTMAYVLAVFAGGQILENYILVPFLVGDRIQVHPVWIIFALMGFGYLFGFAGVLFAVPLAAIIRVVLKHFKGYLG